MNVKKDRMESSIFGTSKGAWGVDLEIISEYVRGLKINMKSECVSRRSLGRAQEGSELNKYCFC